MAEELRPLRIATERVEALVFTRGLLILGGLHIQPGKRFKDELNSSGARFIAVTDARVFDPATGRLLYETDFLLVANEQIVSVTPRRSVTAGAAPWFEPPAP